MENEKRKAQPFDCMQYFYSSVQKPLIRAAIRFNGHLSIPALTQAINQSMELVPQIGCTFDRLSHRWCKQHFTADDVLQQTEAPPEQESPVEKLLLSTIDIFREPQIKMFLVREPDADTLCVIINHMVSDGAGFKEYLYLLAGLYSKYAGDPDPVKIIAPDKARNLKQILQNFRFPQILSILFSKGTAGGECVPVLSLKGDHSHPFIALRRVNRELFAGIRSYAKNKGASVNDLFLTAYIRALHQVSGRSSITVPCPVDLRKYKISGQNCGICNLTSNYFCHIDIQNNDSFEDTLKAVSSQMRTQKANDTCLKGPILFHMLYHTLPFRTVQKLFYKISPVPVTSYTNLGVIDAKKLRFYGVTVQDAYISTAVKYAPYFQLSISTFADCCTITSSLYGTPEDWQTVETMFDCMEKEFAEIHNKL